MNNRLKSSSLNLASGLLGRALTLLLNFIVRTIFIYCLNEAYLSVNGLYSNILTVLSLAELGFGSAMVYRMYAPMADGVLERVAALLRFYKYIYRIIGFVILAIGLCLVPFLDVIIKDKPDVPGLTLYYLFFLTNTVISYWLTSYKSSIFSADQKDYIKTNVQTVTSIAQTLIQIVLLLIFKQYLLYLIVQLLGTVFTNLFLSHIADKLYPQLACYSKATLDDSEKDQIKKDTAALMLTRIGHVVLNGTDNIITSAIVGVLWVGKLSNYTLICDSVTSVLCQITASITSSLGNFFATENKKSGYVLFKRLEFLNFWLYGFGFIALLVLLDPFVKIWAGKNFVLGLPISFALALNFFVAGYMNTLWTFRSTLGLFKQGKYRPLIVALINIILSIILGRILGLFGILFATFLSRAAVSLWYDPIILHKYGFGVSSKPFFIEYAPRLVVLASLSLFLLFIREFVIPSNVTIGNFVVMMFIVTIVPNFTFWVIYHRKEEYIYFKNIFKLHIISRFHKKNGQQF